MLAYIYDISSTLNSKVNTEKLDLEIRAATQSNFISPPYLINGRIYIEFSAEISAVDKTSLEAVLSAHDGAEAAISESLVGAREKKIRELTEMAIYHPLLDELDTVEYLTSVDNWFNSWKRSGVDSILVTKIMTDASSGTHPQDVFLNTVVNNEGNKTFEFLISVIVA